MSEASPYITEALRRCKLPISVNAWFVDAGPDPRIVIGNNSATQSFNGGYVVAETFDPHEAAEIYLNLCRTLENQ